MGESRSLAQQPGGEMSARSPRRSMLDGTATSSTSIASKSRSSLRIINGTFCKAHEPPEESSQPFGLVRRAVRYSSRHHGESFSSGLSDFSESQWQARNAKVAAG